MYSVLFSIFISIDITYGNWEKLEKNNTNPPLFIFCFASWCPHCHGLVAPFKNIQKKYEKSDQIITASLNCTFQQSLCSEFQVRSLPSFIFYYKSKIRSFLNPERNEKGLEYMVGKIINYYDHDTKLTNRLYKNNKADSNSPRFVCKINPNETELYLETLKIISDAKLIVNKTFFFDPDNEDLKKGNCKVFFSENNTKTMDQQVMGLSEFINENKIGYFSKTWDFDFISTLNKFFVLILPSNQESINQEITKEFSDYFAYGSIDPLGIDNVKKMFDVTISEGENKTIMIIIRIKTKNRKKIKYQIIEDPNREKLQLFIRHATVRGQIEWKKVNDKYTEDIFHDKKGISNFLNNKSGIVFLSATILLVASILIGYVVIHFIQNRINSKEE
ncbi:hypothetical protein M9Y10_016123 [Tritrichomonas musculus]|uniref:Thioredoxin domain-containing protein n=1 Tax=Tritrichomonas musculus TaxID=1915356 RepID=A0ABR2I5N6_9EUKA